jgi:hypothetical protein
VKYSIIYDDFKIQNKQEAREAELYRANLTSLQS